MPSIEGIVKALKSQNFGNDDSMLVSGLMHPLEAARKAGQALKRNMDIAAGVPDPYDNPTPWLSPSMEQRAEAGLNFAGLLQTGAMPFAPKSAGGVLGTLVNPKEMKSIIKALESGNKSTVPKVPTGNVFANALGELPQDVRLKADAYFAKEGLTPESINLADIVPTQKNLTLDNLKSVNGIEDPINLIAQEGKYYAMDGHHRAALARLANQEQINANVYRSGGLPETSFSKAHETARKNAMLPIEQGGLGLPENNTAMDRARALGYTAYDDPQYISASLSGKGGKVNNNLGAITKWLADNGIPYKPDYAKSTKSAYLNLEGDLYPTRNGGYSPTDMQIRLSDHSKNIKKTFKNSGVSDDYIADIIPGGHSVDDAIQAIKNTPGIRSRFAAFDPLKKNSTNILASGVLGSLLLGNDEKTPVMGSIIKKRAD